MSPANDLNPAFRPRWTGVLTLYLLAITLGAGSAWLAVRSQLDSGGVSAGIWRTSTLASEPSGWAASGTRAAARSPPPAATRIAVASCR